MMAVPLNGSAASQSAFGASKGEDPVDFATRTVLSLDGVVGEGAPPLQEREVHGLVRAVLVRRAHDVSNDGSDHQDCILTAGLGHPMSVRLR